MHALSRNRTLQAAAVPVAVALVALAGAVPAACDKRESNRPPSPEAVAVVNGEPITVSDFGRALDDIKEAGRGFFIDTERGGRIKRELLERMINTRLLMQEVRKQNIVLDAEMVETSTEMLERAYPPGGMVEELLKKGKTMEVYQAETRQSLLLHKLLKREVVDRVAISREEVEKYYQEHPGEFRKPEEVRVRQIVTTTEEEAADLRKQILRGASFEDLARRHSVGPEASEGGDLGYFPRGRMPPAIEEACFKLYSSHVSRVVASPYGYHLFKLVDRRPARELTLQDAWQEIVRKLTIEKTREAEDYYIRSLRENARIERDLALLDRIH